MGRQRLKPFPPPSYTTADRHQHYDPSGFHADAFYRCHQDHGHCILHHADYAELLSFAHYTRHWQRNTPLPQLVYLTEDLWTLPNRRDLLGLHIRHGFSADLRAIREKNPRLGEDYLTPETLGIDSRGRRTALKNLAATLRQLTALLAISTEPALPRGLLDFLTTHAYGLLAGANLNRAGDQPLEQLRHILHYQLFDPWAPNAALAFDYCFGHCLTRGATLRGLPLTAERLEQLLDDPYIDPLYAMHDDPSSSQD